MTTQHFRQYSTTSEQNLVEDLVLEAIEIFGVEVWYITRKVLNPDNIIVNDKLSSFTNAMPLTMYVKDVLGFGGQGDLLQKFGVEIRDQMTFTVARKHFTQNVCDVDPTYIRPKEGDLIFFPFNKKLFQIRFVEHESMFYQMGKLQVWELQTELYEYNSEIFATGVPEIDAIYAEFKNNSLVGDMAVHNQLLAMDGSVLIAEDGSFLTYGQVDPTTGIWDAENEDLQTEANKVLDFSETDPYGET